MKINNYFLIINLLFIPYYYSPIVFYHNILVNISSTIYWYNYIDSVKINKKLLLIDRICIINAIYNTFILCINFNYMFTLINYFFIKCLIFSGISSFNLFLKIHMSSGKFALPILLLTKL